MGENSNPKPKKSLKEIQSMDDFDFEDFEMSYGDTPSGINEKCLQFCKDYLSDNWSQQTVDTIQVKRMTGGWVNQLYHVKINEPDHSTSTPQEVGVRLYGTFAFFEAESKIRDMVVALMFSENNLGPKTYGLFEEGQILKWYKHRPFLNKEQENPVLVKRLFQSLAKIHAMKPPLVTNKPNWVFEHVVNVYEQAIKKWPINDFIEQYNCQTLKKNDLLSEIKWLGEVIHKLKSPSVFSHNDFRSFNIMVTEPNDQLVVCDFDFARYGCRGYDFVFVMREWGPTRRPFMYKTIGGLPLGDDFRPCIEDYVEECIKIHGKSYTENPINCVDHILKEAKVFLLLTYLVSTVNYLKEEEGNIEFLLKRKLIMEFSELQFSHYFVVKNALKAENIFD